MEIGISEKDILVLFMIGFNFDAIAPYKIK